MEIVVMEGSLLEAEADAIVNAANSLGLMGNGIAGVIKKAAGDAVEKEAKKLAPIPVGKAVLTTAGNLKFKAIIHAPAIDRKSTRLNSSHGYISYALFFFNDTATTEIYTLSLHDALPISRTHTCRQGCAYHGRES